MVYSAYKHFVVKTGGSFNQELKKGLIVLVYAGRWDGLGSAFTLRG